MTPPLSANATDGNRVASKHSSHATCIPTSTVPTRDAATFATNQLYDDLGSLASH
jgi:hypothetical protein